jgi:transposase
VALVLEQKLSLKQAATDLGIGVSTLEYWLKKQQQATSSAGSVEEPDLKKRNAELERQVRRLTLERDILKKAAAYFARDPL